MPHSDIARLVGAHGLWAWPAASPRGYSWAISLPRIMGTEPGCRISSLLAGCPVWTSYFASCLGRLTHCFAGSRGISRRFLDLADLPRQIYPLPVELCRITLTANCQEAMPM